MWMIKTSLPSTNRAYHQIIRDYPFLSVFLLNIKRFVVTSALQFLPIRRFGESHEIYTAQIVIIAQRTTSNLEIRPNVHNTYKSANIWVVAWLTHLSVPLKPRLHRNANRTRTWTQHAKTMRMFDVDKFLRRGKQHSAVWQTFGKQPNAICRLWVHQREFAYNTFM